MADGMNEKDNENECADRLRSLTGKKHILFTRRCNFAILLALRYAKHLGFKDVIIPDEGGWLTFRQYPKKLGLNLNYFQTQHGLIHHEALHNAPGKIVLLHSMPGYHVLQPMHEIEQLCRKAFLINDVSGSIGTDSAKAGDIIVGSFGEDKPINLNYGGFLATDSKDASDFCGKNNALFDPIDFKKLLSELSNLHSKRARWHFAREALIEDMARELPALEPLHPLQGGINLIVPYDAEDDLKKLINLAGKHGLEHVLCPRYIRTMEKAVSFEFKRAQQQTHKTNA